MQTAKRITVMVANVVLSDLEFMANLLSSGEESHLHAEVSQLVRRFTGHFKSTTRLRP
jgi:hypothetical protein